MLTKIKRERNQISKIRNGRGEIATDTREIKRIGKNYYKQLSAKKFVNPVKMDKLLEKHNLPKLQN